MKKNNKYGFSSLAIHSGCEPDPSTGAVITPIYATSTYVYEGYGRSKGFDYARTINPTRLALEKNMASLEGGKSAYAFSSGMAAISALMGLLKAGDHVICSDNTYGGTYRLFEHVYRNYGIDFTYVDTSIIQDVKSAIKVNTKIIYIETPTNPIMKVSDISAISSLTRKKNILVVVDNTFLSPYFQNPISLGADIVVHSTTKFLNGHSDSVGGVVVTKGDEVGERIKFVQNSAGAILSPFDSFLVLRGIKTLGIRMERHNSNGIATAEFLRSQRKVKKVYYPGFSDHKGYKISQKQARGSGSMVSFELGSLKSAKRFLNNLKLISLAESLGGVESLICHPATMTHSSIPKKKREELGISDGLLRISVGIEDIRDLLYEISDCMKKI